MSYNLFDYGSECAEIFVTVNLGTESDLYVDKAPNLKLPVFSLIVPLMLYHTVQDFYL